MNSKFSGTTPIFILILMKCVLEPRYPPHCSPTGPCTGPAHPSHPALCPLCPTVVMCCWCTLTENIPNIVLLCVSLVVHPSPGVTSGSENNNFRNSVNIEGYLNKIRLSKKCYVLFGDITIQVCVWKVLKINQLLLNCGILPRMLCLYVFMSVLLIAI